MPEAQSGCAVNHTNPSFLQGPLTARWLDEADCVGAWEGAHLAATVFPTADCLGALRQIDAERGGERLMLMVNPQWADRRADRVRLWVRACRLWV